MSLTPRSPDEFKPPEIDLGLEQDEKLGEVIAQAKVKAMEEGFDHEYDRGVSFFMAERGGGSREDGEAIARMMLDERRKTLVEAGRNSLLYGVCALSVSCAVGLQPPWAIALSLPAMGAGIYTARKF